MNNASYGCIVRFLGATEHKGARFRVTDFEGNKAKEYPFNYAVNFPEADAAKQWFLQDNSEEYSLSAGEFTEDNIWFSRITRNGQHIVVFTVIM